MTAPIRDAVLGSAADLGGGSLTGFVDHVGQVASAAETAAGACRELEELLVEVDGMRRELRVARRRLERCPGDNPIETALRVAACQKIFMTTFDRMSRIIFEVRDGMQAKMNRAPIG